MVLPSSSVTLTASFFFPVPSAMASKDASLHPVWIASGGTALASTSCPNQAIGAIGSVACNPVGWAARIRNPRAQVSFRKGLVASPAPSSAPPSSAAPGMQRRRSSFAVDNGGGRGTFSAGGGGGEEPVVSAFAAMAKAAAEASLRTSAGSGAGPSAAQ